MRTILLALAFAILVVASPTPSIAKEEVNLYSTRQPELIGPVLDAFTQSTGIKANTVYVQ